MVDVSDASGWTLERIRAICDDSGNPPVHTDSYRTADPWPPAEQAIRLTFADGRQRSFRSERGAPWVEISDE